MRAHLLIVDARDEVVIDQDVNDVAIGRHELTWWTWPPTQKSQAQEHRIELGYLKRVELTPCSDRLLPATRLDAARWT